MKFLLDKDYRQELNQMMKMNNMMLMLHLDLDTMTIKYKKEKILDLKIKNIKRFLLIKVKGFCKKI